MDSDVIEYLFSNLKSIDHESHLHNMNSGRHPCKSNASMFSLSRSFAERRIQLLLTVI